jgi:hypothetical protein
MAWRERLLLIDELRIVRNGMQGGSSQSGRVG